MSEYSASTCERLASELEAADKEMTPGKWGVLPEQFDPWHVNAPPRDVCELPYGHRPDERAADAHGICNLRNSAPEVAAALRSAVARVAELEADRANFGEVLAKTNAALNRAGCFSALYFWEHIDAVAAERDEALALAERRRKDRADVLNVKSTDGLTSSEWLLRTAKAEAERDSLRTRLAALEALALSLDDIRAMTLAMNTLRDMPTRNAQERNAINVLYRHIEAQLRPELDDVRPGAKEKSK